MKDFITRNVAFVAMGLGGVLAVSLIINMVLLARVASMESRVDQAEEDLARVEIGAGLFASEVTGLQNQLSALAPEVGRGLNEAVAGLDAFRSSTLEFDVAIDETIPIETEILLDRTLTVPIVATFPIDEVVETTIPLDVSVPVQLDLPVDLEIEFLINEVIPVSTDVPVRLAVPISIEVAETELASLADALGEGLAAFADLMAGFE